MKRIACFCLAAVFAFCAFAPAEASTLDVSLELMGIEEKAGLFEDVFGYKVVLS